MKRIERAAQPALQVSSLQTAPRTRFSREFSERMKHAKTALELEKEAFSSILGKEIEAYGTVESASGKEKLIFKAKRIIALGKLYYLLERFTHSEWFQFYCSATSHIRNSTRVNMIIGCSG